MLLFVWVWCRFCSKQTISARINLDWGVGALISTTTQPTIPVPAHSPIFIYLCSARQVIRCVPRRRRAVYELVSQKFCGCLSSLVICWWGLLLLISDYTLCIVVVLAGCCCTINSARPPLGQYTFPLIRVFAHHQQNNCQHFGHALSKNPQTHLSRRSDAKHCAPKSITSRLLLYEGGQRQTAIPIALVAFPWEFERRPEAVLES